MHVNLSKIMYNNPVCNMKWLCLLYNILITRNEKQGVSYKTQNFGYHFSFYFSKLILVLLHQQPSTARQKYHHENW